MFERTVLSELNEVSKNIAWAWILNVSGLKMWLANFLFWNGRADGNGRKGRWANFHFNFHEIRTLNRKTIIWKHILGHQSAELKLKIAWSMEVPLFSEVYGRMWKLSAYFKLYSTKILGRGRAAVRILARRKAQGTSVPRTSPATYMYVHVRTDGPQKKQQINWLQLIIISDGRKMTENDTILVREAKWKRNEADLLNAFRWNVFPGTLENSTVKESPIACLRRQHLIYHHMRTKIKQTHPYLSSFLDPC
jgi:hypothetical protein